MWQPSRRGLICLKARSILPEDPDDRPELPPHPESRCSRSAECRITPIIHRGLRSRLPFSGRRSSRHLQRGRHVVSSGACGELAQRYRQPLRRPSRAGRPPTPSRSVAASTLAGSPLFLLAHVTTGSSRPSSALRPRALYRENHDRKGHRTMRVSGPLSRCADARRKLDPNRTSAVRRAAGRDGIMSWWLRDSCGNHPVA